MPRSTCNRLPALSRPQAACGTVPEFIDTALIEPRAGLSAAAALGRMADDFRSFPGMTREDMLRLGWKAEQIDTISAKATIRAQELTGASL